MITSKHIKLISLALIVLSFGMWVYYYPALPDQIPSHWDINGEIDDYIPKSIALFWLPGIMLLMFGVFSVIPVIDPLRKNIESFRRQYELFVLLMVGFFAYVNVLVFATAAIGPFDFTRALFPAIGVLIFYIGVLLRYAKRNWFIGFRTPWTLSSDVVWDKTHQLASKLYKLAGAVAIVGAVLPGEYAFWFLISPIVAISLFLLVYSFIVFRQESK